MSRPTDDELENAENADIGRHGCLIPTGEADDTGAGCDDDQEGDDDEE